LTERHWRILKRVAEGLTQKEIAREEGVSRAAIQKAVNYVGQKWDVRGSAAIVAKAIREGYI